VTAPIIRTRTRAAVDNLGALNVAITRLRTAHASTPLAPPKSVTLRYYDAALGMDLRPNLSRW
jgi:hypothetical protein